MQQLERDKVIDIAALLASNSNVMAIFFFFLSLSPNTHTSYVLLLATILVNSTGPVYTRKICTTGGPLLLLLLL